MFVFHGEILLACGWLRNRPGRTGIPPGRFLFRPD
jgi:hypothetical protein